MSYRPLDAWRRIDTSPALIFLAGFVMLVGVMGLWSRRVARQVLSSDLNRFVKRFNWMMTAARASVPIWFGVGLFALGWGEFARELAGPVAGWADVLQLPMVLIGVSPALLAWSALWWAQYPAERAMREQSIVFQIEDGVPVHGSPRFRDYFWSQVRLQLLFTLVPVLLILLARDVISIILTVARITLEQRELFEGFATLGASAIVFLFAPEILRRVLQTQPLPAGQLRTRLEKMCVKAGLKYRDILLWRTDNNMGNAAVMGLLPRVRYVLLSDLLIESMTDEQIEAVFAHELGHILHKHMAWYVVFFIALMCGGYVFESLVDHWLPSLMQRDLLVLAVGAGAFVTCFSFLSRRFERQADVYAARTIEMARHVPPVLLTMLKPDASYVGRYGAGVFVSALHRVAVINNIPIAARNLTHGSIQSRVEALSAMSTDPSQTTNFDRLMARLYVTLLCLACMFAAWTMTSIVSHS